MFDKEETPFLIVDSILKPEFDWNATADSGDANKLQWKLEDFHFGPKTADRIAEALFELIVRKKSIKNMAG
jgi:hypothetical protein